MEQTQPMTTVAEVVDHLDAAIAALRDDPVDSDFRAGYHEALIDTRCAVTGEHPAAAG